MYMVQRGLETQFIKSLCLAYDLFMPPQILCLRRTRSAAKDFHVLEPTEFFSPAIRTSRRQGFGGDDSDVSVHFVLACCRDRTQ